MNVIKLSIQYSMLATSGLLILLHSDISLSEATSSDKHNYLILIFIEKGFICFHVTSLYIW